MRWEAGRGMRNFVYLIGFVESKWLLQWISSRWKFFVPPGETLSFLRHFNQFEKGSNSEIGRGPS